tara:strand:- start:468 stop:641 length:174 start_codon:yes stop_codon:yes gene_type:complete
MKKFLIIIILISGCSSTNKELKSNLSEINFSDNLSLLEFKNLLKEYSHKSPYPNINY